MWWQGDKRWGADTVGHSTMLMRAVGCLITAIAAARRALLHDVDITPGKLNAAAKVWPGDCFPNKRAPADADTVELGRCAGLVIGPRVEAVQCAAVISSTLAQPGNLVLLHVSHRPDALKGQHWLLATACAGGLVRARDPAQPNRWQRFPLATLSAGEVSPFGDGPYVVRGCRTVRAG